MEIREFTVAELEGIHKGLATEGSPVIPITRHRALAQANNPRAEKSDPALIVAFDGNRVVGYQGILPDWIRVGGGKQKIGWLSTWWVDPRNEFRWLSTRLLVKATHLYDDNIGVSAFTSAAERVYKASGKFSVLRHVQGFTLALRRTHCEGRRGLDTGSSSLKSILRATRIVILNTLAKKEARRWRATCPSRFDDVGIESIFRVDDEARAFIDEKNNDDLTGKSGDDFDWIMRYPWVLPSPVEDVTDQRYYFSSTSRNFSIRSVKVHRGSCMIGFVVFKQRDEDLRVEYVYYEDRDVECVSYAIGTYAQSSGASRLHLSEDAIMEGLNRIRFPYQSAHRPVQTYLINSKFEPTDFDSYRVQAGDGDRVFT